MQQDRNRREKDAAARDYQERVTELDESGTINDRRDDDVRATDNRAEDASADAPRAASAPQPERRTPDTSQTERHMTPSERRAAGGEPKSKTGSVKELLRDNVGKIGLAASSLALLVGTRGGGGAGGAVDKPVSVAVAEGFMLPEEVAAEKGVQWDLYVSDHERVDYFKEFLMGKNYDKTRTWLERIGKYGPLVQNELRERGMPEDLLYLTMIESGLNPNAYSKADAAGLWQFIEETGERYGLEVSEYVDERRDPIKSTDAALTYLQEMHGDFDSWYLSAAGYNTGEGRVSRLMREITGSERGSDEGYWDIWERLPSETRDYVPLMLAMGHIAKEPAKYGFTDLKYEEPLQFEEVIVPGGTKLADVATAAGTDAETIEDLNPHYVKKMTPPGREMAVRVPVGQSQQVASAMSGQVVDTTDLAD